MRAQIFEYRFKEDTEVEIWQHGKSSKRHYKKGDTIRVIGYADDEDKSCAGKYGHAGDRGFQYMGDCANGPLVTGILQDECHVELTRGSIELIDAANAKS
jgi:hypothetical protein